jgi:hypothetical protein
MIMFLVSSQMGTDSEIYQQLAALAALWKRPKCSSTGSPLIIIVTSQLLQFFAYFNMEMETIILWSNTYL